MAYNRIVKERKNLIMENETNKKELENYEELSEEELDEVAGGMAARTKKYRVTTAIDKRTLSGGKVPDGPNNGPDKNSGSRSITMTC
jgi:bacteriocin-like protein